MEVKLKRFRFRWSYLLYLKWQKQCESIVSLALINMVTSWHPQFYVKITVCQKKWEPVKSILPLSGKFSIRSYCLARADKLTTRHIFFGNQVKLFEVGLDFFFFGNFCDWSPANFVSLLKTGLGKEDRLRRLVPFSKEENLVEKFQTIFISPCTNQ
jgi:hypothetical protein